MYKIIFCEVKKLKQNCKGKINSELKGENI